MSSHTRSRSCLPRTVLTTRPRLTPSISVHAPVSSRSHPVLACVPVLTSLWFLCLRSSESPRYLLLKGRDADARKALSTLTKRPADSVEVDEECLEISTALEAERAMGKTTYLDCFRNNESRNGFRTWSGIWIQGWQQLTGVNFIFYYGTTFFKASGISNPFLITIATSVVNVGMTIPGILLIDRAGRRTLLLYGAAIMVFCEYLVAIIGCALLSRRSRLVLSRPSR